MFELVGGAHLSELFIIIIICVICELVGLEHHKVLISIRLQDLSAVELAHPSQLACTTGTCMASAGVYVCPATPLQPSCYHTQAGHNTTSTEPSACLRG